MRTLIIIVSVPLCMYLGGLTVILVVVVASEIGEFSVYDVKFLQEMFGSLMTIFHSDMEPLS